MALPKLPPKPKDELSDELNRAETKALNKIKKENDAKQMKLKDDEVKKATMDFIFGKTDENPLKGK